MSVLCVIGARGGSKGLPDKNIRPVLGVPLIAWSIRQALETPEIDRVVVSTDSEQISQVSQGAGAEVPFTRPKELAGDSVGKFQVWQHALKACEEIYGESYECMVDLDCTSPLRDVSDISAAIGLFRARRASGVDAIFSVCDARKNPYFNLVEPAESGALKMSKSMSSTVVRRQDAPPVYEHVASIYVLSPAYLRSANHLLEGHAEGYDIGQAKSLDVDLAFDLELIEFLLSRKGG